MLSSEERRQNNPEVTHVLYPVRSHKDPQISYGLAKQAIKTVLQLAALPGLKGAVGKPDSGLCLM